MKSVRGTPKVFLGLGRVPLDLERGTKTRDTCARAHESVTEATKVREGKKLNRKRKKMGK